MTKLVELVETSYVFKFLTDKKLLKTYRDAIKNISPETFFDRVVKTAFIYSE